MTEKITALREGIVEVARRWYHSGSNAEAELAALVQEYEAELPQPPSAAVRAVRRGRAVTAFITSLSRADRPVLLAGLVASAGLLLALLCAAGAP